jgi:hypothetical protein
MPSERQLNANRRNAALGGPKTPEGRAAVRFNAVTHGLTAETALLPGEDPEAFQKLREDLFQDYLPATYTERMLFEDFALCSWRLLRLRRVETQMWTVYMGALREHNGAGDATNTKDADRTLAGVLVETPQQKLANYWRYDRAITRDFYRALHELQREQRDRRRSQPIEACEPAVDTASDSHQLAAAAASAPAAAAHASETQPALSENGIGTVSHPHSSDGRRPHARTAEPEHVGDPQPQHPARNDRPLPGPSHGLPLSAA